MDELITFNERRVEPKGLNKAALPDENKVKDYFFSDHYENLSLLNKINLIKHNLILQTGKSTLFYPGCGADILFPLKYVEKLFPELKEINFIFNDVDDSLGVIKTVLDDVGISFEENNDNNSNNNNNNNNNNKNKIRFYWKNTLVNLEFVTGNIFKMKLPSFDIYFERSFNIMKSYHKDYEENVYNKLNPNGILISDSGFHDFPLKKVNVPKELSSYREMIIGVKETSN